MKSFENEVNIIKIFKNRPVFYYRGSLYRLLKCGKPRVQRGKGEPKTDVYVKYLVDEKEFIEIKISLKQTDYNFLENKLNLERFEVIVGKGNGTKMAEELVKSILNQDLEGFMNDVKLEYNAIRHPGEMPCVRCTTGYRLDITNKPNGKRSFPLNLSLKEKMEVFTGATLEERKRDAVVDGTIIKNSGIANVMLEMDVNGNETPQEILDACRSLSEASFYDDFELYATLKAVNYYSNGKYETRPLIVSVEYSYHVLTKTREPRFIIKNPLVTKSSQVVKKLKPLLEQYILNKD